MSVYLLDTPASYYFRIKVPKDLRSVIKKREIKLSLKTENRKRATRLAALHAFQWQEIFNRLRGYTMTDPLGNFTWLKNSVFERRPDGTVRFEIGEMDPERKEAEVAMANAVIDKLGSLPMPPIIEPTPSAAPITQTGIMLSVAIEDYTRVKGGGWDKQYASNTRSTFKIALELLGDKPISDYNENDRTIFFDTIKKLPISWDKRKDFNGLSVLELIHLNETKIHVATSKTRTQKAYLNRMRWLFDWLISKKKYNLSENPFSGIKFPKVVADSEERDQFTHKELALIFNQSIFTNLEYTDPYEYFLLLMALFSGCRMNELAQLLLTDFNEQGNIQYFIITPRGSSKKKVKNANSIRLIPIHPKLVELGLIDYVKNLKDRGETNLFPELPYKNERFSSKASKTFCKQRAELGFEAGTGKDFYSFRHSFATALDRAGVTESAIARLTGHVPGELMTGKRYIKPEILDERYNIIKLLDFDNVLQNVRPFGPSTQTKRRKAGRPKSVKNELAAKISQSPMSFEEAEPVVKFFRSAMSSEETESRNLFAKVFGRSAQVAGLTE